VGKIAELVTIPPAVTIVARFRNEPKAARLAALFAPAPAYGDQNPSNRVSPNAVNVSTP
jgi:hypothetical protein